MALNSRQEAFIAEYCSNGFNATQAAASAGYKQPHSQGSRLLEHVEISKAVEDFKAKGANRALVTVEDIVKGLMLEAQYNGEGSTQSARVAAWKALTDFTGGFDANTQKIQQSGRITVKRIDLSGKKDGDE